MADWTAVGGTLCPSIDWEVGVVVVSDGFLALSSRSGSVLAGTPVVGTVPLAAVDDSTVSISGPSADYLGGSTAGVDKADVAVV